MLRILSDLHCYDARTRLRELAQLEPLLEGVQTLVLNGDTCEQRVGVTAAQIAALRTFFEARVPEVIFVTGNHDPDISAVHEFMAMEGRVWVTHGDIFFDNLTPWARGVDEIEQRIAKKLAADPTLDFSKLAVRLRIAREVAREEEHVLDRSRSGLRENIHWLMRAFFPPQQIWAMVKAWWTLPDLVAALARRERPVAQVVVTGHVHFPRVWKPSGGPCVINTGSFFRPLGGSLVDIVDGKIEVRRIVEHDGKFHPGKLLTKFAV